MTFTIDELVIPATLDGSPAARDFEAAVDVRNAAEVATSGTPFAAYPADELLPGWQPSAHEQRRMLVARVRRTTGMSRRMVSFSSGPRQPSRKPTKS